MGKSEANGAPPLDTAEQMWEKLRPAVTDPARKRRQDPARPSSATSTASTSSSPRRRRSDWAATNCRTPASAASTARKALHGHLVRLLGPVQERRAELARDPDLVRYVLSDGTKRARLVMPRRSPARRT